MHFEKITLFLLETTTAQPQPLGFQPFNSRSWAGLENKKQTKNSEFKRSWVGAALSLQVCDLFIFFVLSLPVLGGCVGSRIFIFVFSQSKKCSENSGSCHGLRGGNKNKNEITVHRCCFLKNEFSWKLGFLGLFKIIILLINHNKSY